MPNKKLTDDQEIKQEERELKIEYFIFIPVLIVIVLLISLALPKSQTKRAVELIPANNAAGYWIINDDGTIDNYGAAPDMQDIIVGSNVKIVAAAQAEEGFWAITNRGEVYPVGLANYGGGLNSVYLQKEASSIIAHPNGRAYRIITNNGEVYDFNTNPLTGSRTVQDIIDAQPQEIIAAVSTKTGLGYWLITASGDIFSFGDATQLSRIYLTNEYVIDATASGDGMLVLTSSGEVLAVGGGELHGDIESQQITSPLIDIDATADGGGYRITDQNGRVFAFGNAQTF